MIGSSSLRATFASSRRASSCTLVACACEPSLRVFQQANRLLGRLTASGDLLLALHQTRLELLQGPNNNKQGIELYTEDGSDRPFFCTISTPGSGKVVRVVNTAPVEFPMTAAVIPGYINHNISPSTPVIGGDVYIGQ